jgi:four helix bundle protein
LKLLRIINYELKITVETRQYHTREKLCVCRTARKLYEYLFDEKREFVLSKQLLRSGTSIRANVEEAIGGHSGKDFIFKLSIAYKEARETSIG